MKRNVCFVLLALILVSGSLFAQERLPFFSSFESSFSFGLFTNEIDAAFDANDLRNDPGIQDLNRSYIFAGLANPYWLQTLDSASAAFIVGGYLHPLGLSAGLEFFSDPEISTRENGTTANTATKPVTSGTKTTNYTYVTDQTETTYSALQKEDISLTLGGLKKMGPMVLAAALNFAFESGRSFGTADNYADQNYTQTTTYYNDIAGAAEAPKMEEDYKETTTYTAPSTYTNLSVMVPFFMPLGGPIKGIGASVRLSWENYNYSTSYKTEMTTPKYTDPGGSFVFHDDFTEDVLNALELGIDSTLSLQPLLGSDPKNRLDVTLSLDTRLPLPGKYTEQDVDKDVDPNIGSLATINSYTQTDLTTERAGIFKYGLDIGANHPLYFPFGDWAELALNPGIGLGLRYWPSSDYYSKSSEQTVKNDGNNDGDFNDAVDSVTTTTTTYYNNNDGDPVEISFPVSLVTAFKWKQKEWIFGVTLASGMFMTPTISFESDKRYTYERKVVVKDGTGMTTSETITTKVEGAYGTSRTTADWSFGIQNSFILNFYLPDNIRLDVLVSSNLFDFGSLFIQAIIPLP
ncbi:hypothetical protein [Spirochaeta thermophila]|uniref:Cell surface protein n=1 Tax=Winmispira thermophila (strain ATCC 49972 / DSM 6192 / RI 19.B1) TaxID=665571 RepID=E0RQU9_WINT6|nr:hypothetical protein [Spirochaeta thermophila]ADN03005.1 hypothetical protein STHERM_c20730 [Spirochaeta thermophila DSM 6192]